MSRRAPARITGLFLGMRCQAWHTHGASGNQGNPVAADWDSLFSGRRLLVARFVTGGYKEFKCVFVCSGLFNHNQQPPNQLPPPPFRLLIQSAGA